MNTGTASRREAIFILSRWMETGDFPDRLLVDSPDRGFIMDLVYGTVRSRRTLEWALAQLMKRPPGGETEAALLLGAYQVLFMEEVPAYAAVHATVEAAKVASGRAAGLVNGVLRNLLRKKAELLEGLAKQPLGVRVSHPDALLTRWIARYGAADAEALCAWNNTPSQTIVAPLSAQAFSNLQNASLTPHPAMPEKYLIVPHGMRVDALPGFAEGDFIVQDPATLAAVDLLNVQPGLTVLDACAAPGGKTVQIAARMNKQGRLIAMDLHEDRLRILRSTLSRIPCEGVEPVVGDATQPLPESWPRFDRILLDAPCSNTGVLRRRPDARWRFTTQRVKRLCATQRAMLTNLLRHLAPGGRLVYSTCSLEPEENLQLIEQTLAGTHAHLESSVDRLPFRDGTDGAFAAAIVAPE